MVAPARLNLEPPATSTARATAALATHSPRPGTNSTLPRPPVPTRSGPNPDLPVFGDPTRTLDNRWGGQLREGSGRPLPVWRTLTPASRVIPTSTPTRDTRHGHPDPQHHRFRRFEPNSTTRPFESARSSPWHSTNCGHPGTTQDHVRTTPGPPKTQSGLAQIHVNPATAQPTSTARSARAPASRPPGRPANPQGSTVPSRTPPARTAHK